MAKEKKKSKKKWWIIGVIILVLIIIGVASQDNKGTKTSKSKEVQSLNIPETQKAFIQAVTSLISEYNAAPNELKKSAVRQKRKKAIKQALNSNYKIVNWVGTLKDMATTSERNAYVSIQPVGCNFRVQTWNNEISDVLSTKTLIPESSPLYKKVAELSEGDKVTFSGSFVSGDDDFVGEQSMTEDGSMTDPEFTVVFNNIEKM